MKIKHPRTGTVHFVDSANVRNRNRPTACWQMGPNYEFYHNWPKTNEPITCKKCLHILGIESIKFCHKPKPKLVLLLSPYTDDSKNVMTGRVYETERHVARLLNEGIAVISLITAFHHMFANYSINPTYDYWKDFCYMMIKKSDKIMLLPLPGWKDSNGLKDELALCKKLHKTVHKIKI